MRERPDRTNPIQFVPMTSFSFQPTVAMMTYGAWEQDAWMDYEFFGGPKPYRPRFRCSFCGNGSTERDNPSKCATCGANID
jgi:rubrerythrin